MKQIFSDLGWALRRNIHLGKIETTTTKKKASLNFLPENVPASAVMKSKLVLDVILFRRVQMESDVRSGT
jgi:hypothetical protein